MASSFTPDQLRAVLRAKGWSHVALARHWDMTTVHLSRLINDPTRRAHWDDAFSGLPRFAGLAPELALRQARANALLESPQPAKRGPRPGRPHTPGVDAKDDPWSVADQPHLAAGYRYQGYLVQGAILTATTDIGELAREGERGIVFGVEDVGVGERYRIVFESGLSDDFLAHHIDVCLAETGLTAEGVSGRKYESRAAVKRDFDAGVFKFW